MQDQADERCARRREREDRPGRDDSRVAVEARSIVLPHGRRLGLQGIVHRASAPILRILRRGEKRNAPRLAIVKLAR